VIAGRFTGARRAASRRSSVSFRLARSGLATASGIAPYAIAKNSSIPQCDGFGRTQKQAIGGDLKYGGDIESDPRCDDQSGFRPGGSRSRPAQSHRIRYFSRRAGGRSSSRAPGSLASTATLRECSYSRRIGRAPQLAGLVVDPTADIPAEVPILGAASSLAGSPPGHRLAACSR